MKEYPGALNLRVILFFFCVCFLTAQAPDVSSSSSTGVPLPQQPVVPEANLPDDVSGALRALPDARVELLGQDGLPTFVVGDLGRIGVKPDQITERDVFPLLEQIAPVFRLRAQDLKLSGIQKDELGFVHVRYRQSKNGLGVVGGDLVVHINSKGNVYVVNGTARDGFDISATPAITGRDAVSIALASREGQEVTAGEPSLTYLISPRQTMHLAYEITVAGTDSKGWPVRERVYVDANDGQVVDIQSQILDALKQVYSARDPNGVNQCVHPGTLVRGDTGPFSSIDPVVNNVYGHMGSVDTAYANLFGRNSWNGAGAPMISTVHHCSTGNFAALAARWEIEGLNSQALFMDHASGGGSWGNCLDIVAHEFTHGVSVSSGLGLSGEAGALNEAWSDIFAAVVEINTGGIDSGTWKLGEDCMPPGSQLDALRYMNNPTADGSGVDNYDELKDPLNSVNAHDNAGIANLAFYLMVNGGVHPRIPSAQVPVFGLDPARQVFYRATTVGYVTGNATFANARIGTAQAATDLGLDSAKVHAAWEAVRVSALSPLNAAFVSQSAPTTLVAGETAAVSVTFLNTGAQTWTNSGLPQFSLHSENPPVNTRWGLCCVDSLPHDVPSGGSVTFNFNITAPSTPGTYSFQWRMWRTQIGVFGVASQNLSIKVVSPPTFNDNAQFISQTVPSVVDPGQSFVVTVVMKNTGSTIWTAAGGYSLGSRNPNNNTIWGLNHTPMSSNIAGGSNANFSFFVTAPTSPGTYNFQWSMAKGFAAYFGNVSANFVVTVSNAPPAPVNLTATVVSNSQVNLSWTDASSNETGFKIERRIGFSGAFTEIATVGANVTTFSNTGLTPLTSYCYRVRSFNVNGNSSSSNEACVTMPDQPPAAPSGFNIAFQDCTISMYWSDNSSNESGFIVEKRVGSFGPFSELHRTGVDEYGSADEGPFQQYTFYYYRVRAYNAAGVSAPSNTAHIVWPVQCN
jgi:vibriolysin